jgi:hypothetical protein
MASLQRIAEETEQTSTTTFPVPRRQPSTRWPLRSTVAMFAKGRGPRGLLIGNGELGMFAASTRLRIAAAFSACALASLVAATSAALSIDLSLNVLYTNPANPALGGTWELVAKSSTPDTVGISSITTYLRDINNDVTIEAPRGTVNGANNAGFQVLGNIFHPAGINPSYREVLVAQLPLFPLPPGSEENLFYGVGTLTNGAPNYPGKPAGSNAIGPTFASFTGPQDIPWATGDVFGDVAWSTASRMLSGTFAAGATPAFFNGSIGNVFTSAPGTNTQLGNEVLASTVTTIVRTNSVAPANSADYNHDGIVSAADYVVWRKTLGNVAAPPGSGADGDGSGFVDAGDYTLWRSHFGNPSGAGSGAGLSTSGVPEPTSGALLTIGALLAFACRRGRFQS